jgi:AcrR family transcriptional regulator
MTRTTTNRAARAGSRSAAPRRRDAAATREAILAAARRAFTELGYDGAGVREIAALAGINVALVNRYFGSKEGLFEEAVPASFSVEPVLPPEREGFADVLARYTLTKDRDGEDGFDPTLAMLRSAGNAQAAGLMRDGLERRFVKPLARWLGGEGAEMRAALVASVLAGTVVMRDVLGVSPLQRNRETMIRLLADLLEVLTEPQSGAARRASRSRAKRPAAAEGKEAEAGPVRRASRGRPSRTDHDD